METRTPTVGRIALAVGFALSCFGLLLFIWLSFGGATPLRPEGYRFVAFFDDATQLASQGDVRISGVNVGRVTELTVEEGTTRAELEIDHDVAPVPVDTRATLREKTLLGETYVELTPGTPPERGGRWLPEGGELDPRNVRPPVRIDQVLSEVFDDRTRESVSEAIGELAIGLGPRGSELNHALGSLGPFAEDTGRLARVLGEQRESVRRLVRDAGTAIGALSERDRALTRLIRSGERVLDTTARQDSALTETVRIAPTFLRESRRTLELARDVSAEADPLLDELLPAAREVSPTLRDLRATAPDLVGLFGDLRPALRQARTGVPALSQIVREARPLMPELHDVTLDLNPGLSYLAPYRREIVSSSVKLAAATQATGPTAEGGPERHLLRVLVPITAEALAAHPERLPSNRHNAYVQPGYLNQIGRPHLQAFDCASAEPTADAPPCVTQPPFTFGGRTTGYPQVRSDRP